MRLEAEMQKKKTKNTSERMRSQTPSSPFTTSFSHRDRSRPSDSASARVSQGKLEARGGAKSNGKNKEAR